MHAEHRGLLLSAAGRLAVAALLLLALFPPPLPWLAAPRHITVVVDDSLSMPRSFTGRAWQQLAEQVDGDVTFSVIRFAASAVIEPSMPAGSDDLPRTAVLDLHASNIEAALTTALRGMDPERSNTLLLLSDLRATRGNTQAGLQRVADAGVPLFYLSPDPGAVTLPFELLGLTAPDRTIAGSTVAVTVDVLGHTSTSVRLVLRNGDRVIAARQIALEPGTVHSTELSFSAQEVGMQQLTASLESDTAAGGSSGESWRTQSHVLQVVGAAPLLHLSRSGANRGLLRSLELAGRDVTVLSAAGFSARPDALAQAGVVLLEDLALGDLADRDWERLISAVRDDGKGLAVLGGGRSFGAGGYRRSRLESILPVTAEAGEPQPPADLMFLLDRSGSMAEDRGGSNRFALARRAVLDSLAMLQAGDRAGIISFAADAELRLPLTDAAAAQAAADKALALASRGGTRLLPALRLAGEELAHSERRKLIVLVTDGFAAEEDLAGLAKELRERDITVIALAVGDDPDLDSLAQLTGADGGRLLRVNRIATLPRLMPGEIAAERSPGRRGRSATLQVKALPFLADGEPDWPDVAAYMVTRAKDSADVFLRSRNGDPLLATAYAGAGRVIALPGGLDDWARDWWTWPRFGEFLGGMLLWLDPQSNDAALQVAVEEHGDTLRFDVDTGLPHSSNAAAPALLLQLPGGALRTLTARAVAAGRYRAELDATQTGMYTANLRFGSHSSRFGYYRNGDREFSTPLRLQDNIARWRQRGYLRPWNGREFPGSGAPAAGEQRWPFLLLALLLFTAIVIRERVSGLALRRTLRAGFSR